jgi:transcriptional regulator with XRE-family HTH domain
MGFSEKLKHFRREKNLSQEQLAELLNVSRQAVSKWEQDNGYPETEKLIQLAQKLDISLDELLLDKQPEIKNTPEQQNHNTIFGERKITVRSSLYSKSGDSIGTYYKFTISNNLFAGKDEPKCVLCGTDSSSFLGDNLVLLGWYATNEDAQKEIDEIYKAMQKGDATYELKYNAKVKAKLFSVKLDSEEQGM